MESMQDTWCSSHRTYHLYGSMHHTLNVASPSSASSLRVILVDLSRPVAIPMACVATEEGHTGFSPEATKTSRFFFFFFFFSVFESTRVFLKNRPLNSNPGKHVT